MSWTEIKLTDEHLDIIIIALRNHNHPEASLIIKEMQLQRGEIKKWIE